MYRPGTGKIGWTVLGSAIGYFDATEIAFTIDASFTGTGTFEGGISGGSFP